ncbi:MAG: 4-alpha-glucanotransferase [Spirochaetaceae bacterium]|jgi:4-alpha-glucanotransferase|nr:4-alpha-glucanotransferase [Spirochaetaceae bacterium]
MPEALADKRLIGVVVPLGALRGEAGSVIGEFPDLVEFARLCKKMNVGLIQILPVNDTGFDSSPYSALSAFALNPIYLRIADLKEASQYKKKWDEVCAEFGSEPRFSYYKIVLAKLELLHRIFNDNVNEIERDAMIDIWTQKNDWVKTYAIFRRLKEENGGKSWKEWNSFQKINAKDVETLWNNPEHKREHLFWVWLQMNLDSQFKAAADEVASLGIALKGDIPIMMNMDSCDVWAHPEYFYIKFSAGAPPDMYSNEGQNWGFPIYNWTAQAKHGYSWWRSRIKIAEKYYKALRIDHILGFFRIWAVSRRYNSAAMGRFVPFVPIKKQELMALGFDENRIHWITTPHIPTYEVWHAIKQGGGSDNDARHVFTRVLERIGNEDLWLFKKAVKSDIDIEAINIHPAAKAYLKKEMTNRILQEYDKETYSVFWNYRNSRQYATLSEKERGKIDGLLEVKDRLSEIKWETGAEKLLSALMQDSSLTICAEDLGVQIECVPRSLKKFGILSLKVVRWERKWNEASNPYVPYSDYPELSVCTTSVHDSSTLREWWNYEADQSAFAAFNGAPSLPKSYNPGTARVFLRQAASAGSRLRIFPLIDLLHLTPRWYATDPMSERINVPGTYNEFNWTWRIPATIAEIAADGEFVKAVKELAAGT